MQADIEIQSAAKLATRHVRRCAGTGARSLLERVECSISSETFTSGASGNELVLVLMRVIVIEWGFRNRARARARARLRTRAQKPLQRFLYEIRSHDVAARKFAELHGVATLLEFPDYLLGEIDRKELVLDS